MRSPLGRNGLIGKSENPYDPPMEKHNATPRRKRRANGIAAKVVSRVIFGFAATWFLIVCYRVVVNLSGLELLVVGVLPVLLLVAVTLVVLYRNVD